MYWTLIGSRPRVFAESGLRYYEDILGLRDQSQMFRTRLSSSPAVIAVSNRHCHLQKIDTFKFTLNVVWIHFFYTSSELVIQKRW